MNNRYGNIQMLKDNMERLAYSRFVREETAKVVASTQHKRFWLDWMDNEYPNMSEETKIKFMAH